MPDYKIRDPQTGKTITIRGESPPTESELEEIFAHQSLQQEAEQPYAQKYPGAPPAPEENLIQRIRHSPLGRLLGGSIAETLGATPALEHFAEPGLTTSPLGAMARGFTTGALEAVTPMHMAAALSLGSGLPAAVANSILAAQGLGEATDPRASMAERIGGGISGIAGGAGAFSGMLRARPLLKAVPPAVKTPREIAQEVVAARTNIMPFAQRKAAQAYQDAFETAASKKRFRFDDTAEKAAAKAQEAQAAADHIAAEREAAGVEAQPPTFSESVSAAIPGGRERMSTRYAKPPTSGEALAKTQAQTAETLRQEALRPSAPVEPIPAARAMASSSAGQHYQDLKRLSDEAYVQLTGHPRLGTPQGQLPKADIAAQVPTEPTPTLTTGEPAIETSAAPFYKTRVDAAGPQYRGLKRLFEAGQVPEAGRAVAGQALSREGYEAGLPSRYRPPVEPAELKATATPEGTTPLPDVSAAITPEAKLSLLRQLLSEKGGSEAGGIDPALLLRLGAPVAGAAVGAPVGAAINPDDPDAPLKGAFGGALLGFAGASGALGAAPGASKSLAALQELINWRNAGLIMTPSAQLKKPLSDISSVLMRGMTDMAAGDPRGYQAIKNILRTPTMAKDFAEGLRHGSAHPELRIDPLGSTAQFGTSAYGKGPLGIAARPYSGWQLASQRAMTRAGYPIEEAKSTLYLGEPEAPLLKRWLALQETPGFGGKIFRATRPFQTIATNLADVGLRYTPGPSLITGDPKTKWIRTGMGTAAGLAGMGQGIIERAKAETGEPPESSLHWGLRHALMGPAWLPGSIGEGLTGPRGMRSVYYAMPTIGAAIPPPSPEDTAADILRKLAKQQTSAALPDWANPFPQESPY